MKGRAISYRVAELNWIQAHSRDERRGMHAAFCARFDRTDVSLTNINSLCKRKGWMTGRSGQFHADQVPYNKGKSMPYNANSAATQFKKGCRTGRANHIYKPIGTERLSKDGYLERKIHDGQPRQSRWRAVHLVEWEAINGPIPNGMALKCLNGDKSNTNPSNWEAIPRAMLPRLNGRSWSRGYDAAPDEVKPAIMAVTKLEHALREAKKG
jgi:hypothetical protein